MYTKEENVFESNVINNEKYKKHATRTLRYISETLSRSLGYYGSTTIIEDVVFGNIITKDGFTILKAMKFGADDTISNTLLKMIKDISQSLVLSVGDGSTSAIITSNRLFTLLEESQSNVDSPLYNTPKRQIIETLHTLEVLIGEELTKLATPITEDNFDVLKNIASVSNNNDEKAGNIIYDIYKEIGKDGFIYMEDTDAEEDHFEVTNGIETSRGYLDSVYANKSNKMESEFINAEVLLVKGKLDKSDIDWFMAFIGHHYSSVKKPLILMADFYTKEFSDFLKINKMQNSNAHINIEMGPTTFNSERPEVYEDLAVYLNANILDKTNLDVFDKLVEPYITNDIAGQLQFRGHYLGSAAKVFQNGGTTRFIEGKGSKEAINERVKTIETQLEYYKDQAKLGELDEKIFQLTKRIGNLKSQIAKLYVSGGTETERATRKYLLEDAIYASKSALEFGYIAGGNLSIPKVISDMDKVNLTEMDIHLLDLISDSFKETFIQVHNNYKPASDAKKVKEMVDELVDTKGILNLKTLKVEEDKDTTIINSVMTDLSIMKSAFSIIGLLSTSNQYLQRMPNERYEDDEYGIKR